MEHRYHAVLSQYGLNMSELDISPLAPTKFPNLPIIPGLRLAAHAAGERYSRRVDLALAELAKGTTIAGAFTRSTMPGAPVDWCRKHIVKGKARAIIVNAGNANVFTGRQGIDDVAATAKATAESEHISKPFSYFLKP